MYIDYYRNPRIHEAESLPVKVTAVISPDNFMCQLAKPSVTELPLLMDKIHDYCTSNSQVISPPVLRVGMACLAMFSNDSHWYRAEVAGIHGKEVSVLFVDYGITDTVDESKIKTIPSDLLALPRLVLPCQLYGVESIGTEWDETSCARFEELVECECFELIVRVMSVQSGSDESTAATIIVQLSDKEGLCNISDMLVDGGYAKRPEVSSFVRSDVFKDFTILLDNIAYNEVNVLFHLA